VKFCCKVLILCAALGLCACQSVYPDEQNTAMPVETPVETETVPPAAEEITPVEIRSTVPPDMVFPDEADIFWEEEGYVFFFDSPISEYVVVEYSDGSTQNVKEALAEGRITIHDVRQSGIQIYSRKPEQMNQQPPCGYGSGVAGFDNIREMIRKIETGTLSEAEQKIYDAHGCDTALLRELTGLDEGFVEVMTQWLGGMDYCLYYQKDEQSVAFLPAYAEEQFQQALAGMDSWEVLMENDLLLNLQKTDLETENGIRYECTFDTARVDGQRITYHEAVGTDGIRRIVTNWYGGDGAHISGSIYVFDKDVPFTCTVRGFAADMEFAEGLRAVCVQ